MAKTYKVIMGPAPYVSNWNPIAWIFGPSIDRGTSGYQSTIDDMANDGCELDNIIQHSMTITLFYLLPRTYYFQLLVFRK